MANYYNDEIKFQLNHPLMRRIVELKERNFADKDEFDYAPQDFEDTMDSYDRVIDLAGDIAENIMAACAMPARPMRTLTPPLRPASMA